MYARFTNRGPDHLDLTVPGVFEFSCGAGNHLVQPIWNSTTDELVSGCTNHGAMATLFFNDTATTEIYTGEDTL
eukprot:COSAG06_NODE_57056_length_282_cov_0.245902_1_plen_73_part_01